jgi:hypothetical protein
MTPLTNPKKAAAIRATRRGGALSGPNRASLRHADKVHRKPLKSLTENARARVPGRICLYHKTAMMQGTSGRSSRDANTKPRAFNRPATTYNMPSPPTNNPARRR